MMLLFWLANTIFWMSKKIQILGIEFLILIFFIFPFEDFFRRGMILRRDTFFGSRVEVPSRIYVFSLAAQSIDLEKYIDIQVFGEFHSIPLGIHEILYACYFTPLTYWLLRRPAYCWGDVERVMGSMLFVDSGTKGICSWRLVVLSASFFGYCIGEFPEMGRWAISFCVPDEFVFCDHNCFMHSIIWRRKVGEGDVKPSEKTRDGYPSWWVRKLWFVAVSWVGLLSWGFIIVLWLILTFFF